MIVMMLFIFIIAILLGIVLISVFTYWLQEYSRMGKYIQKFPSMGPLVPVLGHALEFSSKTDILYNQIRKRNVNFNETFSHWTGPIATLNIITADDAEILLSNVKYIDKGLTYRLFERWLQSGLLTSTGSKWHKRRKMLTPAFHYNILKMFVEIFGEQCENFTKRLEEESEISKVVNIFPLVAMMTLSTICETSMGLKLEQNDSYLSGYYKAICSIAEVYMIRAFRPWLFINVSYWFSPLYWREKKLLKYLHKFTSNIIKIREKLYQEDDVINLESTNRKPQKRLAMLDLLFYSKNLGQIDDAGIREEVDTFVFEGQDTTAAGICFALLLIAADKQVQEKIIAELDDIFGDSKRHATYEDLQNMRYLDCCIKESLRLYPPVPHITRNLAEDVQLTHHYAPAGTEILIHIYDIHRDPKYYPNPNKFDPDRFLPENVTERPPYAYIPFSAGPRNCIGQKFAMLELKSITSSILRNFTLEAIDSPQDLTFCMDLVLRVKEKINVKFIPRDRAVS